MKKLVILSAALFCIALTNSSVSATTYYSQSGGSLDPTTLSNWNTNRLGGGSSPANFTAGDVFVIQGTGNGGTSPHSVTTTATWSISGTGSKLQIENGATLQANSSITVVLATTFQIDNGGTYIQNNTGAPSTTIFAGTESFGATSNFQIIIWGSSATSSTTGLTTGLTASISSGGNSYFYGNLIINATGTGSGNLFSPGLTGTVRLCAGNFSVNSTGAGTFKFSTAAAGPGIFVLGDYSQATGTKVDFDSNTSPQTSNATLNLGGNFSLVGTASLDNTGSLFAAVSFVKSSGTQTVNVSSSAVQPWMIWTVGDGTTTNTVQLISSVDLTGLTGRRVGAVTINSNATLDLNGFTTRIEGSTTGVVTVTGTLTGTTASSKLLFSSSGTSTTTLTGAGTINGSNLTIEYNHSGSGVNLISRDLTINTLTLTAGTLRLNATATQRTINLTNFSMAAGTLDTGSVDVTGNVTSVVNLTGNFSKAGGSVSNTSPSGLGLFVFKGAGAETFSNVGTFQFATITVTNSSTLTLSSAMAFTGVTGPLLTVDLGSTITAAANLISTGSASGNFVINGTLQTTNTAGLSGTASTTIVSTNSPTLTLGSSSTVVYNGAAAQTITGRSDYANLTLNNSSGGSLGGSATVNSTLTLTSGALSVGANTLTLNSTVTVTSGSLSAASGTVIYNQGSNGQGVIAATYGNLQFSDFNKTLASSGTIGIALSFTPGAATSHTITGSTIDFNSGSSETIPAFNYNNLSNTNSGPRTLASSGTIRIAGTISAGSGTYTTTGSTVEYNGTSAQSMPNVGLGAGSGPYNNLIINNSAGVSVGTIGPPTTINGTLTLTLGALNNTTNNIGLGNGATISRSGGSLTAAPSFGTSVNVQYTGSSAITTGPEIPTSTTVLNNLTNSDSGGVTLGADATVNGTLALSSSDLNTAAFTLTENGASTGTNDVVGNVKRTDLGSSAKAFGNPFNTIVITTGDIPTQMIVTLAKGVTFNDFTNSVMRRYTLTPSFSGTSVFVSTVRLHYSDSEVNGNAEANLVLWRKDTTWGMPAGVTNRDGTDNWVELVGVTGFSPWAISDADAPTDVAMVNAKATRYDKHVLLEWQTGYEVRNIGFNIYREKNGNLERITPEPVAGSALIAGPRVELKAGLAYTWWDDEEIAECGKRNADCENRRYWIEDIDLSGRTTTHGPFAVSDAAPDDPLADQHRDQAMILSHRSRLLSALGRDASLAQTAEAVTVPVEPVAKVTKLTAARMSIQSGVASQNAVKMSIQRAGWYRVEQADLVAAGLPSSADPTMLQLFADGKEVPMLVTGASSTVTTTGGTVIVGGGTNGGATGGGATGGGATGGGVSGGKTATWNGVEFYGVGIDSPSTVNHVYWLVVGTQAGLRIGNSSAKGGSPAPSSFAYTVERRDRSLYFPALKNGGAEKWFGPLVYNAQPVDQSVTLQHVTAPGSATMLVSLQGFTNTAHSVRVLFNGVQVGTINFSGQQKSSHKFVIPASDVREGVNQIQLIGPAGTTDMSLVDFVQVTYAHSTTADTNALRIPVSGQQSVTVDGFTSSAVRVMDVTDASSPVELQTTVNSSATSKTSSTYSVTATAPGSGTRVLLAFASDQQKRPAQIAANQPSSYRDPNQRADYLVLTRKDLLGSFNVLADLRKNQGLTPLVIDVEDIYDEFSFGNKSPQAIKDFLSYAKTSWAKAPRFVVLGGDATYDPKNYLGTGDYDLVPTRLVETAYNEAATDDWFVDVNGDAVPDMAIGRLPVRTASEATAMVMKLVSYDSSSASNNVLLVADRNSSFDFEGADTQLRTLIPASMTVTDIRRGQLGDANARSQLLAAFNQGAKIVNFYGHGSTTVWTDAPILSASDAAGLTNSDHLSLVVSMTCLNAYFVTSSIESLGESLLKSQGGAIAVWASSGLTDANAQTVMSRDAITRLFSGSNLTIGEVAALSKASVTNMDVRRTWILLGDPATRLRVQGPSKKE